MRNTFASLSLVWAFTAVAAQAEPWIVKSQWVEAHENFLASDALRGRESATPDEAIAAAYVAAQFKAYGLKVAPGMTGYTQTATLLTDKPSGEARFQFAGQTIAEAHGLTLLSSPGKSVAGKITVIKTADVKTVPTTAEILLIANPGETPLPQWMRAGAKAKAQLVIFRESPATSEFLAMIGGKTMVKTTLEDGDVSMGISETGFLVLSPDAFDAAAKAGGSASLNVGAVTIVKSTTTNAVGWLQGSDPNAGVILISAHLDHLGVQPDGVIMHGANDDASGTTAVLEVAHALAAGEQPKRSILFVAYGSEEIGGLGSTYFSNHSPVPLDQIVANLEFEMVGAQDPKMQPGEMMMTGFDRSDLGETLRAKGAKVAPDIYPDQHFFERSDNYSLALKGVVAHTISGWATTPTLHTPEDDLAHLDIPFMTQAIQSLIVPVEYLANSDFTPSWKPGGKPMPRK